MTVYVDDMLAKYARMIMSHMIADSDQELHAMADTIGVSRKWWQTPVQSNTSHYDIAQSKKELALKNGAVQITQRQAAAMSYRRKVEGDLGKPEDAEQWLKHHFRSRKEAQTL